MADNIKNSIEHLNAKTLKPLYLLYGEDPYYLDLFTDKILDIAIPEADKPFNQYLLYGKDVTVGDILNYARRFPMMAERQLVLVKEAQAISDIGQKDSLLLLENYAKNPLSSTLLVLSFNKDQDERKAWVKAFAKQGVVYQSKKIYDSEVPKFIEDLCRTENLKISPKAIQLLTEHLGNNLQAISGELNKLRLNVKSGEGIDAEAIEKFVGISKEYNFFELQKALLDRNAIKAYQIVNHFAANPKENSIQATIILLYNFFSKVLLLYGLAGKPDAEVAAILRVKPFFIKDYRRAAQVFNLGHLRNVIFAIRQADAKSKGIDAGNVSEAEIYKELVFRILG